MPAQSAVTITTTAEQYTLRSRNRTEVGVVLRRQARQQKLKRFEASEEAEADWVATIRRLARLGRRFFQECTPGYYNNEGKPKESGGFITDNYGGGAEEFFGILKEWRSKGDLKGLELD